MNRSFAFFAVAAFLATSVYAVDEGCPDGEIVTVGAPFRLDLEPVDPKLSPGTVTIIDMTHPATNLFPAPIGYIRYAFPDERAVNIQFASVHVRGTTYRINDYFGGFSVIPTPGVPFGTPELRSFIFHHPLVFDRGDSFALIIRPAAGTSIGLVFNEGPAPAGVLISRSDLGQIGQLDSSQFTPMRGVAMAAFARGHACGDVPAPEMFLPVVGDITGRAHYSTDVSLFSPNATKVDWTIRDRTRDPGAATVVSGTSSPIGAISNLPSTYLGSMTISAPGAAARGTRVSDRASAVARITAGIAAGETGSSIGAVSCEQIGHTIAVPFHVTAGHRVNIGIASAQLNSCGIYRPATAVTVRVNDSEAVTIAMPAESIQLDAITGENSPLPAAKGLTDGVVYVSVTDDGSRIVAYSSLLDNVSQSATLTIGTVDR